MSRKRPSLPVLAALVALVAAILAACSSGGGKAAGPITLSFLANDDGKPVQQLITAFEKANPNIKVTMQGVAVADTLATARSAVRSSTGPDVAQIDWTEMSLAYRELPIVPVQKIAGSGWHATEAGFNQAILKATSYGGITVAMPYTTSIPALFYNPTLFQGAGLDPNTPPATMDQVNADALAIVRHGAQGVYFDVADAAKSDVLTQSLIDGTGGAVIADNGVITVDQPPAVAAMQEMANLTKSGAQPASGEAAAVAAFQAGKLGMLVTSTSQLPSLDAATKGTFTIMAGGSRPTATSPRDPRTPVPAW